MKLCIKNGRVLDPASGLDKTACVNIEDGIIKSIGEAETADETIDAAGKLVLPGLIDLHVHFREPGREDQETIAGGCRIAAKSGYTSVVTMPNTNPPIDNQALVKFIKHEAEKSGLLNIFPAAAVSKGMKGEEISEMGELHTAGAVAFTDDGKPVSSSILMRRALEYSRMFDVPIMAHEEDHLLVDSGVINEGKVSASLGLRGIPNAAEEVMIARDVIIAGLSKGRLHVQHISSGGSVEIIRNAKKRGVKVTCETAPHYFSLTDEVV
ncbi:MAG TPA: dihydroorotase, partial [Spirochaetota bacterium]|nr:dihydroorotase [Spirochaetota bacterium]HPM35042.1 dihydroorotase [Spirochaetota bacterium]